MTYILQSSPRFELITRHGSERSLVQVIERPLVWEDTQFRLEVPLGFICDGASVPNLLWSVLDSTPLDLLLAGIGHDFPYRRDGEVWDLETGQRRLLSREEADELLIRICTYLDVSWFDRQKIFYGIRVGGSGNFHQKSVNWNPLIT